MFLGPSAISLTETFCNSTSIFFDATLLFAAKALAWDTKRRETLNSLWIVFVLFLSKDLDLQYQLIFSSIELFMSWWTCFIFFCKLIWVTFFIFTEIVQNILESLTSKFWSAPSEKSRSLTIFPFHKHPHKSLSFFHFHYFSISHSIRFHWVNKLYLHKSQISQTMYK